MYKGGRAPPRRNRVNTRRVQKIKGRKKKKQRSRRNTHGSATSSPSASPKTLPSFGKAESVKLLCPLSFAPCYDATGSAVSGPVAEGAVGRKISYPKQAPCGKRRGLGYQETPLAEEEKTFDGPLDAESSKLRKSEEEPFEPYNLSGDTYLIDSAIAQRLKETGKLSLQAQSEPATAILRGEIQYPIQSGHNTQALEHILQAKMSIGNDPGSDSTTGSDSEEGGGEEQRESSGASGGEQDCQEEQGTGGEEHHRDGGDDPKCAAQVALERELHSFLSRVDQSARESSSRHVTQVLQDGVQISHAEHALAQLYATQDVLLGHALQRSSNEYYALLEEDVGGDLEWSDDEQAAIDDYLAHLALSDRDHSVRLAKVTSKMDQDIYTLSSEEEYDTSEDGEPSIASNAFAMLEDFAHVDHDGPGMESFHEEIEQSVARETALAALGLGRRGGRGRQPDPGMEMMFGFDSDQEEEDQEEIDWSLRPTKKGRNWERKKERKKQKRREKQRRKRAIMRGGFVNTSSLDLYQYNRHIKDFVLSGKEKHQLSGVLPRFHRKQVHMLADLYQVKSQSSGHGARQHITLIRTQDTFVPQEQVVLSLIATGYFMDRPNIAPETNNTGKKPHIAKSAPTVSTMGLLAPEEKLRGRKGDPENAAIRKSKKNKKKKNKHQRCKRSTTTTTTTRIDKQTEKYRDTSPSGTRRPKRNERISKSLKRTPSAKIMRTPLTKRQIDGMRIGGASTQSVGETTVGYRLLREMGWTGGAIGSAISQGDSEEAGFVAPAPAPIIITVKNNTQGLGYSQE